MPERTQVTEGWTEYRRLVLQQLEEGHSDREKIWTQIRKIDSLAKENRSAVAIRLDRIEQAEKIKMWVLRAVGTGVLGLILKEAFSFFTGG